MNDDQEMAALRSKFSELAECHARELRAWLDRADVNHADLKRMVHNLAGTAGMLGFDDVAEVQLMNTAFRAEKSYGELRQFCCVGDNVMMRAPLVAMSRRRFATRKNCFGRNGVADSGENHRRETSGIKPR